MNRSSITVMAVLASFIMGQSASAGQNGDAKPARSASSESDEAKPSKRDSESSRGKKSSVDISEIINSLDYPELQVVPRATERLRIEAKDEEDSWIYQHWPMEMAGLSTLVVGVMGRSQLRETLTEAQKTDAGNVSTVTTAVGAGWFAAGLLLGMKKPYGSGLSAISKIQGKDERSVLLRERLAEEAMERPAKLMGPLLAASTITNLGMSVLMGAYLTDQGRIFAGISAALAFLPMIFEDHTVMVYNKHLEYKKKIYGPLSSAGLGFDQHSQTFYPTTTLTWMF